MASGENAMVICDRRSGQRPHVLDSHSGHTGKCLNPRSGREQPQEPSRIVKYEGITNETQGTNNWQKASEGGEKPPCRWRYPQGTGEYLCCGYDEGHSGPHETVYVTHGSQTFLSNQELWYAAEPATPVQRAPDEELDWITCAANDAAFEIEPEHTETERAQAIREAILRHIGGRCISCGAATGASSPRSGMGAREFRQRENVVLLHVWGEELLNRVDALMERYADERVRQADQQSLVDNEQLNDEILALQAEVEQLRQERDDDEQMWRERCDAASKAGYEVAMEQEREARERVEGALREAAEHIELRLNADDVDERANLRFFEWAEPWLAQVKSSEGEAK